MDIYKFEDLNNFVTVCVILSNLGINYEVSANIESADDGCLFPLMIIEVGVPSVS